MDIISCPSFLSTTIEKKNKKKGKNKPKKLIETCLSIAQWS